MLMAGGMNALFIVNVGAITQLTYCEIILFKRSILKEGESKTRIGET